MNADLLYQKIRDAGLSVGQMCKELKMSRSAFYRKTRGISEFTQGEIEKICEILSLDSPVEVFFAKKVS